MSILTADEWDWSNFTGFFWAAIAFCCIIYTYFRVPEPRGRSFAELDLLFERRVSARKFESTQVDVFDEDVDSSVVDDYGRQLSVSTSHGGGNGHGKAHFVSSEKAV